MNAAGASLACVLALTAVDWKMPLCAAQTRVSPLAIATKPSANDAARAMHGQPPLTAVIGTRG